MTIKSIEKQVGTGLHNTASCTCASCTRQQVFSTVQYAIRFKTVRKTVLSWTS